MGTDQNHLDELNEKRSALVAGLRELADFLTGHPEMPVPLFPTVQHQVLRGSDEAGIGEVQQIAAALGVAPEGLDRPAGRVVASRRFGGLVYEAFYMRRPAPAYPLVWVRQPTGDPLEAELRVDRPGARTVQVVYRRSRTSAWVARTRLVEQPGEAADVEFDRLVTAHIDAVAATGSPTGQDEPDPQRRIIAVAAVAPEYVHQVEELAEFAPNDRFTWTTGNGTVRTGTILEWFAPTGTWFVEIDRDPSLPVPDGYRTWFKAAELRRVPADDPVLSGREVDEVAAHPVGEIMSRYGEPFGEPADRTIDVDVDAAARRAELDRAAGDDSAADRQVIADEAAAWRQFAQPDEQPVDDDPLPVYAQAVHTARLMADTQLPDPAGMPSYETVDEEPAEPVSLEQARAALAEPVKVRCPVCGWPTPVTHTEAGAVLAGHTVGEQMECSGSGTPVAGGTR